MELIRFYNVADGIVAGTTGRGVVENGNSYSGFNICHYVGDKPNHTDACLHNLADILGLPIENIISPRQIHSDKVVVVSEIADFRNVEADALITTLPDVAVGVNTADCVPVLLADTANGIVATIHAGWRGLVNGIIGKTVSIMSD
ncbi:MAG: laccase domain-containing protein, partial [Muribaculaceae bacterium]|nr:laccase domain-containing protein [Muribaculaceae bacterium]